MKKQFLFSILVLFLVLGFLFSEQCLALEKETHRALNEQIAKVPTNSFSLNTYLINQLGFNIGVEQILNGKEVWKWVRDGGRTEDEPMYTRSLNHFHDPLKTWDSSGFKGTFKSSIVWAQDQGWIGSQFGGDWSWKKARDSFYKALTAMTKIERDNNFSETFRGLGQAMHLVQNSSVPDKVKANGIREGSNG
ncbi:MAG: hypothetical protein HY756_02215 [Nitrospirae bacterium]|nr:hypothetical protein [Nitrospirota bacterium]